MDDDHGFSDAELADIDLGKLFAGGITGDDGRLSPALQGIGSVAAAVQLENHLVTRTQVARTLLVLKGQEPPLPEPPPPALAHLVDRGIAACRTDADRTAFLHWLGLVVNLMTLRARVAQARWRQ
ncbi:MAG: hypothetical protein ACRDPC_04605 [Solirubrobacteraceae bacterium]